MIPPVRSRSKPPKFSGPPRVRHEPPTIEEAIAAAQDLAADPQGFELGLTAVYDLVWG